jgi:hypothetical protein
MRQEKNSGWTSLFRSTQAWQMIIRQEMDRKVLDSEENNLAFIPFENFCIGFSIEVKK